MVTAEERGQLLESWVLTTLRAHAGAWTGAPCGTEGRDKPGTSPPLLKIREGVLIFACLKQAPVGGPGCFKHSSVINWGSAEQ